MIAVERMVIPTILPRATFRRMAAPTAYRIVIRIDDRSDCRRIASIVEDAHVRGGMSTRIGSRISGRVWLEIGSYPREVAEAKAEVLRTHTRRKSMNLDIQIKKNSR
jgi:hypothetical protein